MSAHNFRDHTGETFGDLTVLCRAPNKFDKAHWKCMCRCGNTTEVATSPLRSGHTRSCGCGAGRTTHGMHNTPEYIVWQQMKERCLNPRKGAFARYGARGIGVSSEWAGSFEAFFKDMGPRPSLEHTLERRDNDRGYEPGNCYWATWHEQYRNRRSNVWLELDGLRMCLLDWAKAVGIDISTLSYRLHQGWDLRTALYALPYYNYRANGPLKGAK